MYIKPVGVKPLKVIMCVICMFTLLFLTSCMAFSDWEYDMQNGYAIWRVNSHCIVCGKIDGPNSIDDVGGDYVARFYYNSRYIFLYCVDVPEDVHEEVDFGDPNPDFYIIDVETDEVTGPLTYEKFDSSLAYTLEENETLAWINTTPRPEGAECGW